MIAYPKFWLVVVVVGFFLSMRVLVTLMVEKIRYARRAMREHK